METGNCTRETTIVGFGGTVVCRGIRERADFCCCATSRTATSTWSLRELVLQLLRDCGEPGQQINYCTGWLISRSLRAAVFFLLVSTCLFGSPTRARTWDLRINSWRTYA